MGGFETSIENIRKWFPAFLRGQTEVGLFPDVAGNTATYQRPRTREEDAELLRSMISAKINENVKQKNAEAAPSGFGMPQQEQAKAQATAGSAASNAAAGRSVDTGVDIQRKVLDLSHLSPEQAFGRKPKAEGVVAPSTEMTGEQRAKYLAGLPKGHVFTNKDLIAMYGAGAVNAGGDVGAASGGFGMDTRLPAGLATQLYERAPSYTPSAQTLELQGLLNRGWFDSDPKARKDALAELALVQQGDRERFVGEAVGYRDLIGGLLGGYGIATKGSELGLHAQQFAAEKPYRDANISKVMEEIGKLGLERQKLQKEMAALPGTREEAMADKIALAMAMHPQKATTDEAVKEFARGVVEAYTKALPGENPEEKIAGMRRHLGMGANRSAASTFMGDNAWKETALDKERKRPLPAF